MGHKFGLGPIVIMRRAKVFPVLILLLLFLSSGLFPQSRAVFYGKAMQGNIIIGKAKNIKSISQDESKIPFDKEGYFVIGFDRDAKGKSELKIIFKDKKTETYKFNIDTVKYMVQEINGLKNDFVSPSKKQLVQIAAQSKIINLQKKKILNSNTAFFKTGFMLPISDTNFTGVFGSYRILNGVKKDPHNGVDFDAETGTPVKAAADGIVILAERNFFYNGTFIMIDHGLGLTTNYLHLSKLKVARGAKVKKGQIIGYVGRTGRATGPHLHWGAQLFKKRIDPLSLVRIQFVK